MKTPEEFLKEAVSDDLYLIDRINAAKLMQDYAAYVAAQLMMRDVIKSLHDYTVASQPLPKFEPGGICDYDKHNDNIFNYGECTKRGSKKSTIT